MEVSKRLLSAVERMKRLWENSMLFRRIDHYTSKRFQRRLTNSHFTILCSNCIGGIIYHRLGQEFLSPTINMFFLQRDFVSFCLHLDYYLGQELAFLQTEFNFPVAELLGNGKDIPTIRLFFNHAKDQQEAGEKWVQRKSRINRDNLYIILYNLDGISIEELEQLEQISCQNKVVLSSVPIPEIAWSVCIKPARYRRFASAYLDRNIFGVRRFERKFDFVSFLNKRTEE